MVGYVTSVATFGMALFLLTQFDASPLKAGYQLVERPLLDRRARRALDARRRRHQPVHGGARARCCSRSRSSRRRRSTKPKPFIVWMLLLESAMIGVFLALDVARVLHLLRVRARADVLPHRGLGPRQPALRGDEVLPLHDGRFRVPVRRDRVAVAFMHQHSTHVLTFDVRMLTDWAAANIARRDRQGAVPRVRGRLRGQGPAVPVPHVAARRAHRRADRGFGRAGRRDAEDRRVRVLALRDPVLPAGRGRPRAAPARARRRSGSPTARSSPRCNRT